VAFGFDQGPEGFDFAGFANEERATDDAHEGAAHELFFLPGAEFLNGFVGGIAEQREIELVFFLERSESFDGVGAHAEDGHAEFVEFLFCVTKLGRFDGSTGGVGLGEEKEQGALASEVFEGEFFALLGLQAKGRGFSAYFEHGNIPYVDIGV
jgi:hypothetical protein